MMKILIFWLLPVLLLIAGCTGGVINVGGQMPVITSFEASPSSISTGGTSNLSWNVSGATNVTIDHGIGDVALTGTRSVTPPITTVYMLTATNTRGMVTATTQVIVTGVTTPQIPTPTLPTLSPPSSSLPVINYFIISPNSVNFGSSVTLSWSTTNTTAVTIDNGVGEVGVSGSITIMPVGSTIYTLTATNAHGSKMATASVGVLSEPPPP
jgi:hypothetical protein